MNRSVNRASKRSSDQKQEEAMQLRREIGLLTAISLILGTVVGSGIFIAPKGVLMNSGSVGLSLLVWILCGLLSLCGALCFAELGTSFPESGGQYTYMREIFGPLPAFVRLWVEFMFIRPSVTGYMSLAFGSYMLGPFFAPCAAPPALVKLVAILGITFIIAINCWSVTMASRIQVFLTFVKLFALALIIVPGVIALSRGQTEHFQNGFEFELLTLDRLPLAFYNGLYAYSGWFYLNCVTEEVINPNRNLPLAIAVSMVTVTILYVLTNVAYYTMMSPAELLMSDAVAVTFANRAIQTFAPVIPLLVSMSCLGAINGGVFGSPRMLFVGGRDKLWPPIFSMIHINRRTPLPAVILQYPLTIVMILSGEIYKLLNFASFSRWFFIALATLGVLIHRKRFPLHPRPFKVPLVVPLTFTLACFFIVILSLYSDPFNTGCSLGLMLTGPPVYYITIYRPSCIPKKWKHVFNYCSRQLQILLEVSPQEVKTY